MDYKTARNFLIDQGTALDTQKNPDAFLNRLQQGQPPIPGQVTNLLLALKITFDALQGDPLLDRILVYSLHCLTLESSLAFENGRRSGVEWPPLLKADLHRISLGVKSVFGGTWYTE